MTLDDVAQTLDHAILHPTNTDQDVVDQIRSLKDFKLASFCVKPCHVKLAKENADAIPVCTVIGFPHGSSATEVKVKEVECASASGATEFDMVVNIGKVLSHDWDFVRGDIQSVLGEVRKKEGQLLKVIFETDYLVGKTAEKVRLCQICSDLKVDFVKTSTGFGYTKQVSGDMNYTGATADDIELMLRSCNEGVKVKASGGIRTAKEAIKFIEMGCDRIGTGSSLGILRELEGSDLRVQSKNEY